MGCITIVFIKIINICCCLLRHSCFYTDCLSQTLSMLDLTNSSDYTFFDRQKIRNFKCPNHWKEKFEMMKTDSNVFLECILFITS